MKVAVTGGTGFIGRRLVDRHVQAGDSVRVLSRRSASGFPDVVEVFPGDLTNESTALSAFVEGADVLYHCAAELRDASRMRRVQVAGTERLLRAAVGKIGRWVQLSSVGVYGPVKSGLVTESSPTRPVGEYETTKCEAERLIAGAVAIEALDAVVLRPSNVFAPEMPSSGLFRLTGLIKKRRFAYIGKPGAIANYIHVDNVVGALLLCATSPEARGATYNLSDWRTLERFVAVAAEALGVSSPSWRIPEPVARGVAWVLGAAWDFPLTPARIDALTTRAIYDTSKIERELGYRHHIALEPALEQTVRAWHGSAARFRPHPQVP